MTAISTRLPDVTVEFTDSKGQRTTKHFPDAHKAKRFFTAKDREGANPAIVPSGDAPAKPASGKHVAVYMRVSTNQQTTKNQLPELQQWAKAQSQPVKFYEDSATGKDMNRPGWLKLEAAIRQNRVSAVVCWRIDRLGRTASGLTKLFDELQTRKVNLVSLKDGLDLSTPAGRLMANVLASIAQFETELRGERVASGIARARASGKKWGGSLPGVHKIVSDTQVRLILDAKAKGESITAIAAAMQLSRPTIYRVLKFASSAVDAPVTA